MYTREQTVINEILLSNLEKSLLSFNCFQLFIKCYSKDVVLLLLLSFSLLCMVLLKLYSVQSVVDWLGIPTPQL